MTLPTIPCRAFTVDDGALSKGTETDIVSELRRVGALHKPTKLEEQALPLIRKINQAIVSTLSEHHVRVLKSGTFLKSLSPAKQRARKRGLAALGRVLDGTVDKAVAQYELDQAHETLTKATARREAAAATLRKATAGRYDAERAANTLTRQVEQVQEGLAVVSANLERGLAQQAAQQARRDAWQQRQRDEAEGGLQAKAMATSDPDLRAAYLEMAGES